MDSIWYEDTEVAKVFKNSETAMGEKWGSSEPTADNECVGLKAARLFTYPCNDTTFFTDGTDLSKPALGYICEAKIIPTLDSSSVCVIPFKYQGITYDSCSFEIVAELNPDGMSPWCATEVDEHGNAVLAKMALCKDERSIMPYGSGSGHFCSLPFLFNGIYYDHCTRKDFTMQSKFAQYYWCPDPNNITASDEYEYFADRPVGACPKFLHPPDNGCPENYDPITDEICIRTSAYKLSYEEASNKCKSEGAYLLQYTSLEIEVEYSFLLLDKI